VVTRPSGDLPVLVVDGAVFSDFQGFVHEFTRLLDDYTWHGSLDAFNDILRGGFGTPEGGWALRWVNSELSRAALGHGRPPDAWRACSPRATRKTGRRSGSNSPEPAVGRGRRCSTRSSRWARHIGASPMTAHEQSPDANDRGRSGLSGQPLSSSINIIRHRL
jgi:hypothetical protein